MSKRVVSFPDGAQDYLSEKYGLPRYSNRHLRVLVLQGRYPAPNVIVSERKKAVTTDLLDEHAERLISGVSTIQAA
jgi:hypothetical protein